MLCGGSRGGFTSDDCVSSCVAMMLMVPCVCYIVLIGNGGGGRRGSNPCLLSCNYYVLER